MLDHGTEWNGVMHSIAKKTHSKNLKEVYEVVALARAVRNTAPGDFPVPFVSYIPSAVAAARGSQSHRMT